MSQSSYIYDNKAVVINSRGKAKLRLFYPASNFQSGMNVTGYIIYPDATKSDVINFTPLGDGIYTALIPYSRKTSEIEDLYGVVIKEDGEIKYFGHLQIIN